MKSFISSLLGLSLSTFLITSLPAKDVEGSQDHPILKRIEGSEIIWSKVDKFGELVIPLEGVVFDYDAQKFKATKQEKGEGARTTLYYKLPGETSTLEAVRQYEADLKPAGFQTLFTAENDKLDDGYGRFVEQTFPTTKTIPSLQYLHSFNKDEQRYMALKGTGKSGNTIYVTLYAFILQDTSTGFDEMRDRHALAKRQTVVRVDVLETKAMEARMTVVKAAEITQTIQQTGRIAIYGVLFDTDKADIKPESADSLAEMAKAIQENPTRKYLIVGHTDNVGDFSHNQALSQKRAAAVTAALTAKHQIPANRIIPVGVGMAAPVAPNHDDPGRAKNRRVEIVEL
ncbi:MAG: OmpA family protein [Akkermansiaceae bacterium]|nr:OmpA family protein [Akkermansiaceae bacterium]NJR41975.1 OmpA family protein [Akkermansiaceae bacterium]